MFARSQRRRRSGPVWRLVQGGELTVGQVGWLRVDLPHGLGH